MSHKIKIIYSSDIGKSLAFLDSWANEYGQKFFVLKALLAFCPRILVEELQILTMNTLSTSSQELYKKM